MKYRNILLVFVVLSVCITPNVYAGGVHFGFGVDVPFPGRALPPPVVVSPPPVVLERPAPPVVIERTAPPPAVVVEQAPPAVVIKRTPPTVVYEGPVVVERRSTEYYYPPSYEYHSSHSETEREYYRQRSRSWEDSDQY